MIWGLGLLFVLLLDQGMKWWVRSQGMFWTLNQGVAFSIGQDWWWIEWVVWGVFLILIVILSKVKHSEESRRDKVVLAWGLILGGVVSNLIDRLFLGGVVDYIQIDPFNWGLPVFNLGDVAICVGVGIWLIDQLLNGGFKKVM